jgi:hypothetical protein
VTIGVVDGSVVGGVVTIGVVGGCGEGLRAEKKHENRNRLTDIL